MMIKKAFSRVIPIIIAVMILVEVLSSSYLYYYDVITIIMISLPKQQTTECVSRKSVKINSHLTLAYTNKNVLTKLSTSES